MGCICSAIRIEQLPLPSSLQTGKESKSITIDSNRTHIAYIEYIVLGIIENGLIKLPLAPNMAIGKLFSPPTTIDSVIKPIREYQFLPVLNNSMLFRLISYVFIRGPKLGFALSDSEIKNSLSVSSSTDLFESKMKQITFENLLKNGFSRIFENLYQFFAMEVQITDSTNETVKTAYIGVVYKQHGENTMYDIITDRLWDINEISINTGIDHGFTEWSIRFECIQLLTQYLSSRKSMYKWENHGLQNQFAIMMHDDDDNDNCPVNDVRVIVANYMQEILGSPRGHNRQNNANNSQVDDELLTTQSPSL